MSIPTLNLSGRWKGKYTYGLNYPPHIASTSEPFELDIQDNEGIITGTCIDDVVKKIKDNESRIEGRYEDGFLNFLKTYKYHPAMDEYGKLIMQNHMKTEGVHYVGHMHRRMFSGKIIFKGEWQILSEYKDYKGNAQRHISEGTWEMTRA